MDNKVFEIKTESFLNSLNLEQLGILEVLVKQKIEGIHRDNYRNSMTRRYGTFAVGDKVRWTSKHRRLFKPIRQYSGVVVKVYSNEGRGIGAYRVQADEVPYPKFLRSADQLERIEGGN